MLQVIMLWSLSCHCVHNFTKKALSQAIGGDDSRANLLKLHYGTVLTQHCETLLAPNYVTALAPHYETDCVTVQASCQTFPARV